MLPEVIAESGEDGGGPKISRPRRSSNAGQSMPLLTRRNSKIIEKTLLSADVSEDDPSRRSSINFNVPETPPRRPSIRPGGKLNLGSVGRRLSMMRRMSKPKLTPTEPQEEKIELPSKPRFLSLLSPEAQYAAMKCYEDLLFDKLLTSSPEYSSVFERTPSPPQNLEMLCIKDKPENSEEETKDKDDDGYGSDSDSERHFPTESRPKPVYIPLTALTHRSVTDIKPRLPPLSQEKKLMMSYRFQCAFDILDALKLREGNLITSPRVQSAYPFDPVRNFATWHHNWSKEFKIVNKRNAASARI